MVVKLINDSVFGNSAWFNGMKGEEFDVIGNIDKQHYYVVENGTITNKMIPKGNCSIVTKDALIRKKNIN